MVGTVVQSANGGRRESTRVALLDAGEALLAVRPLGSVSVDDIVERASVAKGSFYKYFSDKNVFADVVSAIVQQDVELKIAQANVAIVDPIERIVRAMCTVIDYALTHTERLQALLSLSKRTASSSPLNKGMTADVRDALLRGRRLEADIESNVLIILGIINTTVRHIMSGESRTSVADLAGSTGAALLRAIGVPADEAARVGRAAADNILGKEI